MKNLVLSCLESRVESHQTLYGRFLLAPFKNGNALTMGTALRRALLSQIPGIAITALDIQGITHEFSTIVGVRESVLELSLNFQRIVLRDNIRLKNVQVGYLQVRGPAVIYANDLKLPRGIECVDPTQYIATLSRDGLLVLKFLIEKSTQKSNRKKNNSVLTATQIRKAKHALKNTDINPVLTGQNRNHVCIESAMPKPDSDSGGNGISYPLAKQIDTLEQAGAREDRTVGSDLSTDPDKKAITYKRHFVESPYFLSNKCLQNVIPLEIFVTPVNKANFVIQTDDLSILARERLVLEVWTNGSIHPRQAIHSAALSLMTLFSEFRNLIHLDSHSVYKSESKKLLSQLRSDKKKLTGFTNANTFFLTNQNTISLPQVSYAVLRNKETRSEFKKKIQSELQINFKKRLSFLYKSNLDKTSLLSSDLSNFSLSLKTYIYLKQKGIHQLENLLNISSSSLLQLVNGNKKMFYEIKRCLFVLGLQ